MTYLLQRSIYYLSLSFGIILLSFVLFHAVPTDPARIMLGPNAEEAQVDALRSELGLDRPLSIQFATYLRNVAGLDFGTSFVDGRAVRVEVGKKLTVTLVLILASLILTLAYVVISIGTGILGIWKLTAFANFLWVSLPTMFSALLIAILSAYYYPFTTFSGTFSRFSDYLYLLPPAFILALYPMAVLSRIARAEMVRIDQSQFVIAARAKGLTESAVFRRHTLRNILIPFLAALSNQIPILFTSTFIVEIIFSIPGIGSLLVRSLLQRDFPMLEGIVIVNGLVIIVAYMLFEFIYPLVDPRVRDSRGAA
uniref:Peptide/nickel transport system permease protein n=1 Tax=Candidatus Kentrum sp. FW TaxID=2126338 RepID=A0A450SPA7_9GAMM|nr:MAG: peptide/nickel transport system permease protein [Candidatus Kentron sp. FW]